MQMNTLPHFDAVILADGEFPTADIPLQILREAKFLCCCDGAAAKAIAQGFMPDAIVGDGDSLTPEFKTRYAAIIHLESEQEDNDLTKASRFCIAKGFRHIAYLAATGKREDHTIGNIFLMPRYVQQFGITPEIYTDHGWFSVINGTTELPSFPGQQVSIFNITGKKVEGEGFTWPPYTYNELWQGTLNEAKSDRILLKTDGIMIVFRTYLAKKT
jgi:thiamine pyrophosphokinase